MRASWWIVGACLVVMVLALIVGRAQGQAPCQRSPLPVVVNLDDVKHANLIAHEADALALGYPRQLTLERDNADARRKADLRGIPTRPGFDRDEYPPAVTEESGLHSDGRRASVEYVPSSENRSGGSVLSHQLAGYCDGQRFIIEAGSL
jgi:hypothetical protein